MRNPTRHLELSLSEVTIALCIATLSLTILSTYLIDLLGFSVEPFPVLLVVCLEWLIIICLLYSHLEISVRIEMRSFVTAVLLVTSIFLYVAWLGYPSLLPVSFPYDMTHHLSLIDYIAQRHALPHDPALQPYLEVNYTPGSHILGALAAMITHLDGFGVFHVLSAAMIALKAGLIFNLARRIQANDNSFVALAAALMLLVPFGYFLESLTIYGYFAQIVSEVFTIAMLSALVAWNTQPARAWLVYFALCGCASYLTWPLWIPIPILTCVLVVAARHSMTLAARASNLVYAIVPIGMIASLYTLSRVDYALEVLTLEGGALKPWFDAYGGPFLVLFGAGVIVGARQPRLWPLTIFAGLILAQTAGLIAFDVVIGEKTFYLPFKMLYLFFYVQVLFVAFVLGDLWRAALPIVTRWTYASALVPVLVLLLAVQHGLPLHPETRDRAALYDAGRWAKANLPVGCVAAYDVGDNGAAYWLYVSVFGMDRNSPRVAAITTPLDPAHPRPDYASDPRPARYAILGHAAILSSDARPARVIYQVHDVVVVERSEVPDCVETIVTIEDFVPSPRTATVAYWLASFVRQ